MKHLQSLFMFVSVLLIYASASAQSPSSSLLFEPFVNRVFIEEQGQFANKLERQGLALNEPVLYALENAEFNAYFFASGIEFRFAEYKIIPKGERVKLENEPEERGIETIWHSVKVKWLGANSTPEVFADKKVHEYYNYTGLGTDPNINFVPAFDELTYRNIYDGVDMIFELPDEGGIKYRFEVAPGNTIPDIRFEWSDIESLNLADDGSLMIKSIMTLMQDKAPSAFSSVTNSPIPTEYVLDGNVVRLKINPLYAQLGEGFVIDPWIVNTSYPAVNRAHDIQEDAAGNIVVHGNHTNYQVQKFNSAGVLQWTYVTASIFLGDIAVDNPGNVYIVGGYNAGKRQKLDPNGVQLWTFSGLVEEWRLAFNYSKTVLTIGGYFINPGGNNLARFDVNTGAISNQIIYGEETRGIATDCNGDMYSLHVTFGFSGGAATNLLRKTNADFTPAGSVQSGFLLAEAEPAAGYAPNPSYSAPIYQGFNGLVVSGQYVYICDGATIRRVNKTTLTMMNSAVVPGGAKLQNSGLAADLCGNIYAGSLTGIMKFDSTLNYIETIATPGAVYDIIFGSTGELLVAGDGYVGSFAIVCNPPPAITATANNACDGTGSISINVAGGLAPYTYVWQPGGMTTNPINGLPSGVYTYTVNDAFCRTYIDSVEIYEIPVPTFTATGVSSSNNNPNSVCLGETMQFNDNSTATDGNIISWDWDFGDGTTSTDPNPTKLYTSAGQYTVELVVTTDFGCTDSSSFQINVDPLPVVNFTATETCFGDPNVFSDASAISSGTVASWAWDFGDGSTAATQNPTHQYASSGLHSVQLLATSANGCSDMFQADVQVYDLPQADFTFPSTCVNDPTDLIDNSTDGDWPINTWTWTAEGQTLAGASGQHTFSGAGAYPVQLVVSDQFGCADSITQQVNISVRPQIAVSVNDDCEGEQFVFSNTSSISSGSISQTSWDMGDGNTYSSTSPTNVYANFGVYTVQLSLTSDLGCVADTNFQVEAFPNPTAALQWQNQCDGTAIPLTETSSVPLPGVLGLSDWNMGDGTILTDASPTSHSYASFGNYNVQLTVETQHGCTDVAVFPISVHAVPQADFSFINICETDSAQFTDQSLLAQGNITDWHWDFGNGQVYSGQIPGYQSYAADGFYPVQLSVTSDSACVSVLDETIEIYPSPVASFSFDSVCFPLAIQFQDLSNPNGSYAINQWAWQFSDGQTSSVASPSISFPQFGAYSASLLITNAAGCKDQIDLGDALLHPLPVADYSTDIKHCFLETIQLVDGSTVDVLSDDQIVSWVYDLGDGNIISSPNGSHSYAAAGFYDLELEVTTNHGCVDQFTNNIEVFPLPDVLFDATPKEGCDPLLVQFVDQSTIPAPYFITQWQWDLGDGSAYPVSQNPTYIYDVQNLGPNDASNYNVSLQVTSANGCSSDIQFLDLITVHPVPYALFSTDPDNKASIIDPLFQFTDLSTVNVSSWQWNFGDASGSIQQNPDHRYLEVGTYSVTLTVTTDFGCSDTTTYTVIVKPQFTFYIPSAFTPNNDGINDLFFGTGENIKQYHLKVFDRWGERIFESNSEDFKWDGSFKGKQVEAGQYVYEFNILDGQNLGHEYSGSVMLLR